jgi:DNA gyrase inhibitor GyrI
VRIRQIPTQTYAAVRYSGMNTENRINEETARLQNWAKEQGLISTGVPELARYNPPWTLPMFRRNEIMMPVKDSDQPGQ